MSEYELSPEGKNKVLEEFRRMQEQGLGQPRLEPSLLGLDWSLFEAREFPELGDWPSGGNPPEFISFAFSALDAYATAVLAAPIPHRDFGVLSFTCSLKVKVPNSRMSLKFATIPEKGRVDSGSMMVRLLQSFPQLLEARGLEPDAVLFLVGEDAR